MNFLYTDPNKVNWDQMPFPKRWYDSLLVDKVPTVRGYLKGRAFDHSEEMSDRKIETPITTGGKLVWEYGYENQIMYWLKQSFSMLEAGIPYSDAGEHLGLADGTNTQISNANLPPGWFYLTVSGNFIYTTQVWENTSQTIAQTNAIPSGTPLYPFFPTKMRFGQGAPTDITTPINPADIHLNDTNAQGPGNIIAPNPGYLNFIYIDRTSHITLTTTGFSLTSPSGYYADYGSVFHNITVYQVTMPANAVNYPYDGTTLNEAGLFCDAALTGTTGGTFNQLDGMLLAKRYFSPISKTSTISIQWQWSIVS
jgi:hypothetical protein